MEKDLHHLESPSTYQEFHGEHEHRPLPSIHEGISTPKYHEMTAEDKSSLPVMVGKQLKPPSYDGKRDPRAWLYDYNFTADANLWDESKKFNQLIGCLTDAPLEYFRNER